MSKTKKSQRASRRAEPLCSVISVKPPLGIMPERIWKEHRAWELMKCIVRHESQPSIPGEWWDELRRLLVELGTPNATALPPQRSGGRQQQIVGLSNSNWWWRHRKPNAAGQTPAAQEKHHE